MDAIRTHALTRRYGPARGVAGLDLSVAQGSLFGFIGPNGAGKSTTIRLLLGLLRPSSGSAQVLGLDSVRERGQVLARVGYLPAQTALWPGLRVREVLELSAALRGRDCQAQARQLCGRLRLDAGRRVDGLSLGERRKVGIVCALQHQPELLVLDEPTNGLDPLIQREFWALLRERNQAGATVFLSSHLLAGVQRHCTHAAIIRDGTLVASGSMAELARAGGRRVRFCGRADVQNLPGVRALQTTPDGAELLYSGPMPALLGALAAGDVRELTVSEPELEDVFLQYYGQGGRQDGHIPA